MPKSRMEAFSDGVIAILITIMVLELRQPAGTDLVALRHLMPVFLAYLLSFVNLGIYWNNHHHMLHAAHRVNGTVLWANLHLLFWLSLFPFTTAWIGEQVAALPTASYGVVALLAAIAYYLLQNRIVALEGRDSTLARAIGRDRKGRLSPVLYALAIPVAFWQPWAAIALYVLVALIWLVPDRRVERMLLGAGTQADG
ncbi:MAG TPA: TMEM175 family protein [Kineosporiaceae bacterium]|nr:TMEM175 family protein [Kineosporiaceae bacterium]